MRAQDISARPENRTKLALFELLRLLRAQGYHFVTPTPATHRRVLARPARRVGHGLGDLLGWSLPVSRDAVPAAILDALETAELLDHQDGMVRSRLRVSSLQGELFLHSAYPTEAEDAVFFGPDSYRFADLIVDEIAAAGLVEERHIVDIGTGAGVGAVVAGKACPTTKLTMTDINPAALQLATVNACAAGITARAVLTATLDPVDEPIDLALANPPYIVDPAGRDYRDGGGFHGGAVALDMAKMAVNRLAPGGRLILYTGSAIIDGADRLHAALRSVARAGDCALHYREIDPDVFGEELAKPAYADVDRIAVVAAILIKEADA